MNMKDMNDIIRKSATELGFLGVYFLTPDYLDDRERQDCEANKFECVLVLMYPYLPFDMPEYIPSYYPASNASFHAMKTLIAKLSEINVEAKNVYVPVKKLANAARLGGIGRNTLLHTTMWGSRIVLYTLLVKGAEPEEYANLVPSDICVHCRRCVEACPTKAITEVGYIREKCIRHYMDTPPYPKWVETNITTYLGCEICMSVCPYNAHLEKKQVPNNIRAALDLDMIISGDVKEAKHYLGSNVKTKRLIADAEAIKHNRDKNNE